MFHYMFNIVHLICLLVNCMFDTFIWFLPKWGARSSYVDMCIGGLMIKYCGFVFGGFLGLRVWEILDNEGAHTLDLQFSYAIGLIITCIVLLVTS